MTAQRSDALVFFGATGDLAYKQIFPALQAMVQHGKLDMPVIGVAKSGWNLQQLLDRAHASLVEHGGVDEAAYQKLSKQLVYIDGDYQDDSTYQQIHKALGQAKSPLHYLAVPASLFGTVATGLGKAGCANNARVVIEKPFGRDLKSAQELNTVLQKYFPEQSIYRIDHFLGKEPVQNLVYFRFANPLIEAVWNHRHISSVQITMAENFGIKGRGKMYEELGAIRDVVQNHMLQVVAALALESPGKAGHEAWRDERAKLLKAVKPLSKADTVRGQYTGYRNEEGVAASSLVETYAAVKLTIENDRWQGVPFYVRAGKFMPVTSTEVLVRLKQNDHPVLNEDEPSDFGYLRFRISPEVVLGMGVRVKKPGEQMLGESMEMIVHDQPPDQMTPYERLLTDATNGDSMLFAREDSVEESWRIVDPVLDDATELFYYNPGTWGPEEAEFAVKPEGGWHNPAEKEEAV